MSGRVRSELSKKNNYYISKEHFYELKHFCLQYPEWKKTIAKLKGGCTVKSPLISNYIFKTAHTDKTGTTAVEIVSLDYKIRLVEECVKRSDKDISEFLLLSVTEGIPYDVLRYVHGMPCGKDLYYDRYHKFFWLLSQER